jgi:hydrogenase maturation protease
MKDDAIGLEVVRSLASHPALPDGVEAIDTGEMGLSLLDLLVDRDWAILVDSIVSGKEPVGHVHTIKGKDVEQLRSKNPHGMGIGEVLFLGRQLGLDLPEDIAIVAMEIKESGLGEGLTPEVKAGSASFLKAILGEVRIRALESRSSP